MAAKKKKIVCVDSSVFISYLKGGTDRQAADVPLLKGFFNDVQAEKLHIVFPTLERSEILQCKWEPSLFNIFQKLLDLPNVDEVPVNTEVSAMAADLRSFYSELHKKQPHNPLLSLADAHILATAIFYECDALYTYDGDREPPSKPRKLLGLVNPLAGKYALHISKPDTSQLGI